MTVITATPRATAAVDTPLKLGRLGRPTLRLKNRIVTSPMERNYGTSDGRLPEQYLDYLPPAPGREAALSRAAGVPVVLAGTLTETVAPIVSTATKSGFDAAQRLAHHVVHPDDVLDSLSTGVLT